MMSSQPGDILDIFYREDKNHPNLTDKVKLVLLHLVDQETALNNATVYLYSQDWLFPYASTTDHTSILALSEYPLYHDALHGYDVYKDQSDTLTRILIPFASPAESFGVLDLEFQPDYDIDEQFWQGISRQFALAVHNHHLSTTLTTQVNTLSALKSTNSFRDVASILARYTIRPGQFVTINYFRDDRKQHGIQIVATANRHLAYEPDEFYPIEPEFLKHYRNILENSGEYLTGDIERDVRLPDTVKDWLRQVNIRSSYQLLLQHKGVTYGFVAYNDTKRALLLSQIERQAFRSIADEVAVILENHNLQQQRESALKETQTLYQISDALMHVADIPALLQVIMKYAGRDARSANLIEMTYDDAGNLQKLTNLWAVTHDKSYRPEKPTIETFSAETLKDFDRYWKRQGDHVEVIEDTSQLPDVLGWGESIFHKPESWQYG